MRDQIVTVEYRVPNGQWAVGTVVAVSPEPEPASLCSTLLDHDRRLLNLEHHARVEGGYSE